MNQIANVNIMEMDFEFIEALVTRFCVRFLFRREVNWVNDWMAIVNAWPTIP